MDCKEIHSVHGTARLSAERVQLFMRRKEDRTENRIYENWFQLISEFFAHLLIQAYEICFQYQKQMLEKFE